MTDACENITLPQTSFACGKNVFEPESLPLQYLTSFWLRTLRTYRAVCCRCEHFNSLIILSQTMTFYFIQLTTVEVYPVIYLAYANSALNPLIYGGLNNNLRRRAAALLRKLCSCCTDSNRISPAGNISYSETSAVRV